MRIAWQVRVCGYIWRYTRTQPIIDELGQLKGDFGCWLKAVIVLEAYWKRGIIGIAFLSTREWRFGFYIPISCNLCLFRLCYRWIQLILCFWSCFWWCLPAKNHKLPRWWLWHDKDWIFIWLLMWLWFFLHCKHYVSLSWCVCMLVIS